MERIAYFDNAATTFPKPPEVYDFADAFYRTSGGNAGRGGNGFASAAKAVALEAKDNVRRLYRCPAAKIAFTASATEALNRIILGAGLQVGDKVYITPFEHNAVTRPLNHLAAKTGISIEVLPFDRATLLPDFGAVEDAFRSARPAMVIMTHASNVCGAIVPVDDIARLAKAHGATVVVDMSQTCGLLPIDLASDSVDFAVFAGHKTLYAPFGVGGFLCRSGSRLEPVLFGGNGMNSVEQEMPDEIVGMTEIGSQNAYAIAGLKASTDWIISQGMDSVFEREAAARDSLRALLRTFGCVSIVADGMRCARTGVVSAVFDGYSPDEAEQILGRAGVAVRSGLHCAPYAHRFLGTLPAGTVRFSVGALTGEDDFAILGSALEAIEDSL